jgi:para-aminobenzoate synthetase component 1
VIAIDGPALAPAEAARRAARAPGPFWLSSPAPDEISIARDLVGAAPAQVVRGDSVVELERAWAEARGAWREGGRGARAEVAVDVDLGIPVGVGWLSYDLARSWMGLPPRTPDAATEPFAPLEFHFHDAVWVRPAGGRATIFARDEAAARRLHALLDEPRAAPAPVALGALAPDHDDGGYLAGVRRVLAYLAAGDTYQVNLARRVSVPFAGEALELAAALRARTPAPFGAFIAAVAGDAWLVGNSPELFLALDGRAGVETRPIKGTAPRGRSVAAARAGLVASAKDRAEHVMIVDLERNDLGRVCETGSVRVEGVGRVLELPTLLHLVSTVRGRLRADVGLEALLAATFPCGSITGAPKRRAMQIIDELEPVARGPYTGATGWLGANGDLELAVAIRTALVSGGRLTLSLGGGVVADSTPEGEWAETEVKARAFERLAVDAAVKDPA